MSRTRQHIETLLTEHKATDYGVFRSSMPPSATVVFRISGWAVRMKIPLPSAKEFRPSRHSRGRQSAERWVEQTEKERWRALLLCLKAKFIAVEGGVETFEQAFLPHLVLRGGSTVWERHQSQLGSGEVAWADESLQLGSGE